MLEISVLDGGLYLRHDIGRDWIHLMGSFCVFCNLFHQLGFGGSRGLKPTVFGETCKGWHLFHHCVIILSLLIFFPGITESSVAA